MPSRSRSRSPRRNSRGRSGSSGNSRKGSKSPVRALYVSGFAPDTNARDLVEIFEKKGKVDRIHMKERFAFVTMSSGGKAAVKDLDGSMFDGGRIRVEFSKGKGPIPSTDGTPVGAPNKVLFCVNFDKDTDKKDFEDFFKDYDVKTIDLRSQWAFVTMNSIDAARDAVKNLDGKWLRDRQITVTFKAGPGERQTQQRSSPYRGSRPDDNKRRRSPERRRDSPPRRRRSRSDSSSRDKKRSRKSPSRSRSPAPRRRSRSRSRRHSRSRSSRSPPMHPLAIRGGAGGGGANPFLGMFPGFPFFNFGMGGIPGMPLSGSSGGIRPRSLSPKSREMFEKFGRGMAPPPSADNYEKESSNRRRADPEAEPQSRSRRKKVESSSRSSSR